MEHYAGLVTYDVTNFVEKNRDAMISDLLEVWESSSDVLMRTIAKEASGGSRAISQSMQFKGQVRATQLLTTARVCVHIGKQALCDWRAWCCYSWTP